MSLKSKPRTISNSNSHSLVHAIIKQIQQCKRLHTCNRIISTIETIQKTRKSTTTSSSSSSTESSKPIILVESPQQQQENLPVEFTFPKIHLTVQQSDAVQDMLKKVMTVVHEKYFSNQYNGPNFLQLILLFLTGIDSHRNEIYTSVFRPIQNTLLQILTMFVKSNSADPLPSPTSPSLAPKEETQELVFTKRYVKDWYKSLRKTLQDTHFAREDIDDIFGTLKTVQLIFTSHQRMLDPSWQPSVEYKAMVEKMEANFAKQEERREKLLNDLFTTLQANHDSSSLSSTSSSSRSEIGSPVSPSQLSTSSSLSDLRPYHSNTGMSLQEIYTRMTNEDLDENLNMNADEEIEKQLASGDWEIIDALAHTLTPNYKQHNSHVVFVQAMEKYFTSKKTLWPQKDDRGKVHVPTLFTRISQFIDRELNEIKEMYSVPVFSPSSSSMNSPRESHSSFEQLEKEEESEQEPPKFAFLFFYDCVVLFAKRFFNLIKKQSNTNITELRLVRHLGAGSGNHDFKLDASSLQILNLFYETFVLPAQENTNDRDLFQGLLTAISDALIQMTIHTTFKKGTYKHFHQKDVEEPDVRLSVWNDKSNYVLFIANIFPEIPELSKAVSKERKNKIWNMRQLAFARLTFIISTFSVLRIPEIETNTQKEKHLHFHEKTPVFLVLNVETKAIIEYVLLSDVLQQGELQEFLIIIGSPKNEIWTNLLPLSISSSSSTSSSRSTSPSSSAPVL